MKHLRLHYYDYFSNGFYFITINTNHGSPYLVGALKKSIKKYVESLSKKYPGVFIDSLVIMDDHLHMIIELRESRHHLGSVIRGFKAITSKSAGYKLWQPNYYEHVIRHETALKKIREYIKNNPIKKVIDINEIYGHGAP